MRYNCVDSHYVSAEDDGSGDDRNKSSSMPAEEEWNYGDSVVPVPPETIASQVDTEAGNDIETFLRGEKLEDLSYDGLHVKHDGEWMVREDHEEPTEDDLKKYNETRDW